MENLVLMIKPASSLCNLRCSYCFYEDVSNCRDIKSYGMMSIDTIDMIVKRAFETGAKVISFSFQGGEPSLASDEFFDAFIQYTKQYNTYGAQLQYAFQTNAFALSDHLIEIFKENHFLVGVSLDGPRKIHDLNRIDTKGNGSFRSIMNNIQKLKDNKIDFNILAVVNKSVVNNVARVYNFYKTQGFKYLQFTPCIENFDGLKQPYMVSPEEFGTFLCKLFDLWYADFMNREFTSIRYFDNLIQMLLGMPPESCAMNGICTVNGIIEADGSVYPCDFYMLDQYKLGNVYEEDFETLFKAETGQKFIQPSFHVQEKCKQCEYLRICRGGCRREREYTDGKVGLNKLCEGYKMFFDYSMERLLQIAKIVANR